MPVNEGGGTHWGEQVPPRQHDDWGESHVPQATKRRSGGTQCMGWRFMRKYFLSSFVRTHRNLCVFLHRRRGKPMKSNVEHRELH